RKINKIYKRGKKQICMKPNEWKKKILCHIVQRITCLVLGSKLDLGDITQEPTYLKIKQLKLPNNLWRNNILCLHYAGIVLLLQHLVCVSSEEVHISCKFDNILHIGILLTIILIGVEFCLISESMVVTGMQNKRTSCRILSNKIMLPKGKWGKEKIREENLAKSRMGNERF
ncbi:hypothetical protein ACJX0J_035938, partial [Zea mays]